MMTISHKFTPPPWKIAIDFHDDDESLDYMCVVADGCVIANTILEDDARLIAAAPDLLQALIALDDNFCTATVLAARAAIAKATGAKDVI